MSNRGKSRCHIAIVLAGQEVPSELSDRSTAAAAPGFVFYFKGPAAADRSCLSFCLWTGRREARAASGKPNHVEAVSLLNEMYESYNLEFLRVTGRPGQPLLFEPYDRPVRDDPIAERAA